MSSLVDRKASWNETSKSLRWSIPFQFNIAEVVCDRHARDPEKIAMIHETESGDIQNWTFLQIQFSANRLPMPWKDWVSNLVIGLELFFPNVLKRELPT